MIIPPVGSLAGPGKRPPNCTKARLIILDERLLLTDRPGAMSNKLVIEIEEGCTVRYGYETGLNAVYEALRKELGADIDKIHAEIIEE